MQPDESELKMARRHVAAGRELVDRQQLILNELRADKHLTDMAEQLLTELQASQDLHQAHLARLENDDSGTGKAF